MRCCLLATVVLLLLAGLPSVAVAEEVFVLEGGSVVRGTAIREMDDRILVRLSSYYDENTITLRRTEITKRYMLNDAGSPKVEIPSDVDAPTDLVPLQGQPGVPHTIVLAQDPARTEAGSDAKPTLPGGERALDSEGFFERLKRVGQDAMPPTLEGRLILGFLLLVMLSTLVAGGTRFLGMKAASLQASTTLGFLLGVFLVADTLFHGQLLRADRALWVIPLQGAIWLGVARASLEAPLSRTIPLLALMLFAATAFAFAVGSVLVSV